MPYSFTTNEDQPLIGKISVRSNADPYVVTAEFAAHAYNEFDAWVPTLTVPVVSNGNDLTLSLTNTQVNTLRSSHFMIRAVSSTRDIYIESGQLLFKEKMPSAHISEDELVLVDANGNKIDVVNLRGPKGDPGSQGPAGPVSGLTIGTVSAGTAASASIIGAPPAQVLNLVLPQGDTGPRGPQGATANLQIGTVTTGLPGANAQASVVGLGPTQTLNLTIPSGLTGAKGDKGDKGDTGARGAQGDTGRDGIQGIQGVKGDKGDVGPTGPAGANGSNGAKGDSGDMTPSEVGVSTGIHTLMGNQPRTIQSTLSGNVTVAFDPQGSGTSGKAYTVTLIYKQPATGGPWSITWPIAITWAGGAPAPAMPAAPNARMMVNLFWTGTEWLGLLGGTFF